MRRTRQTKIVATLGPATSSAAMIEKLFMAGVDVFRLNFSHGERADHKKRFDTIRQLENETGRPIAILLDLQGPKLRIGTFKDGPIELEVGARFRFDLEDKPGDGTRVRLPHPEIFKALEPGTDLLLDDGRLRLTVETCDESHAECTVAVGGELSERKGVNVPGVVLPLSPLTEKDRADLDYGLELGVDWVALSFVQRPEDMAEAAEIVQGRAGLMAKLEKPAAIDKLDEIVDLSDAIMVARGDLGVEMPPEDVPVLQREIVRCARREGKPVVVATQMLDSMIDMPVPTRAEASDVATAVYDGADAVMLSAETAVGDYPVETVTMMNRIIERVQKDPFYRETMNTQRIAPEATTADAISAAARQIGDTIEASAIVAYTTSGSTALRMARERPARPIISLTPREATARKMSLVWGVHSARAPDAHDLDDMMQTAMHQASIDGFAGVDDRIVITAGVPFGTPGKTNLLRIARLQ
ncbi:pyruvate kinase [Marivibrio halodurans]|uniref:Pyruvate kinase n=1 Tax=Marivibrio halodurans TaxID=2039722 RepID=A0A8J7V1B4_9PROT|nr:pyruvate kinase [Marivibrio halodurans]MBP5856155.1 pyruvate kinase [Marivibrio halodurans]